MGTSEVGAGIIAYLLTDEKPILQLAMYRMRKNNRFITF
jgi:hypothetical protein